MANQIPVIEEFLSIEGEGSRAGRLCYFVRVAGCNLRCSYCDSTYSYDECNAEWKTVEQIFANLQKSQCDLITLTGGEPLLNEAVCKELLPMLIDYKKEVNIETNGSVDIERAHRTTFDKVMITMDWKSLSSGMSDKMRRENLELLQPRDVLKFVVGDRADLDAMYDVLKSNHIRAQVYISPIFGKIQMAEIVDFMKEKKMWDAKIQCQLHKIIWDPQERGV